MTSVDPALSLSCAHSLVLLVDRAYTLPRVTLRLLCPDFISLSHSLALRLSILVPTSLAIALSNLSRPNKMPEDASDQGIESSTRTDTPMAPRSRTPAAPGIMSAYSLARKKSWSWWPSGTNGYERMARVVNWLSPQDSTEVQ